MAGVFIPRKALVPATSSGLASRKARSIVRQFLQFREDAGSFFNGFPDVLEQVARQKEAIVPALVEALDHPVGEARLMTAVVLTEMRHQAPRLFANKEWSERALQLILNTLKEDSEERCWVCLLLTYCAIPKRAVPFLHRTLASPDVRQRSLAAACLSQTMQPSQDMMAALRAGLVHEYPVIAAACAIALLRLGLPGTTHIHSGRQVFALEELSSALDLASTDCQSGILLAISRLGDKGLPFVPPLVTFADNERNDAGVRGEAIAVIGRIGSKSPLAIENVERSLSSRIPEIVRGGVEGLIHLKHFPMSVVDQLTLLLSDANEDTRIAAASAITHLESVPPSTVEALIARVGMESNARMSEATARALAAAGSAGIASLIGLLREQDPRKLSTVASAFIVMGEEGGKALAAALAEETDEYVQLSIVILLRDLHAAAAPAVEIMASLLDETDDEELTTYLLAAILVTGRRAAPATPALIRCVANGTDEMMYFAERALRDIGQDAVPGLEEAMKTAEPFERNRLAQALAAVRSESPEAFGRIEAVPEKVLRVFLAVGDAIGRLRDPTYEDIAKLLKEDQASGKYAKGLAESKTALGWNIKKLEALLMSGPLIGGKPGGKRQLTDQGQRELDRVRRYLAARDTRRRE